MGVARKQFTRGSATDQCSIHCESSRAAQGPSTWRWVPQPLSDAPRAIQKMKLNLVSVELQVLWKSFRGWES